MVDVQITIDGVDATPSTGRRPVGIPSEPPTDRAPRLSSLCPGAEVLDEVGVGILVLDKSYRVAATNNIADKLVKHRRGQGTVLADLVERAQAFDSSTREAPSDPCLVEAIDAAGRKSVVGYRFVRSPSLGTIFTLRDITSLDRARAERQVMERLSQVGRACAMVAHEIGNPLAAIKATVQSIEREVIAAGLGDPMAAVSREIDRLDAILGQILGFVRHRAPRKVRHSLVPIVASAKLAAAPRLGERTIFEQIHGLPDLLCDPDQIQQVLVNLLLNAADATSPHGAIWVKARTAGDQLSIRVEDNGSGIPFENRAKVFESFFTTKQSGVGLGLSVSYRIIVDHGGSMSIEDRESAAGTCIQLYLPIAGDE